MTDLCVVLATRAVVRVAVEWTADTPSHVACCCLVFAGLVEGPCWQCLSAGCTRMHSRDCAGTA
jgi:hypothetical protein